ncbi:thiamine pyrophosphate-requiring protein [Paracoccus aminophilus]|uniref:Acetolactate synthase large subunit n=1 Tax=Paracoccus aminophilus JCM 7686 TaxID=1367847 RepID=S5XZ95_PARAH|nr:thiamine pyrophosphate-requiring protein [Paracoccus aminophilus]AGT10607.1 acetolactate synthase large subunit [Paracoccus aminophilus JCM 7686]
MTELQQINRASATEAAQMTGAAYIAGVLKQEGVRQIIGYPASELFDAAAALEIPPLIARSQRVAVNIAEGYARATAGRELAVVTVQYGPGAESSFAGIAQAFNDRAPVLFLPTGYPRGSEAVTPNFESRRNFAHITKWCETATRVEDLPKLLHAAISRIRYGAPAPVLLELPVDLLNELQEASPQDHLCPRRSAPQAEKAQVAELMERLLAARHPVILAGQGVLAAEATPELVALAEALEIPVMTTPNGKSGFPENHPLALGTAARARPETVDHYLEEADLVLAIGTSLTRSYYILPVPEDKIILQVTLDDSDIGKDYPVTLGVVADARAALCQMLDHLGPTPVKPATRAGLRAEIAAHRAAFLAKWMPLLTAESSPISPYRVIWEMVGVLDPDRTIITHDAGNPRDQLCPFYVATQPGGYIGWGKTTQLGSSLGFALGAKLARPEAVVVNLMGEAAFGMVGIDFETAVRCDLPVLTVVLRNNVLGGYARSMPVASQKYEANRVSGEYASIAEALGGYGECVTEAGDLRAALLRGLDQVAQGRAALIEVVTHEEPRLAGLW